MKMKQVSLMQKRFKKMMKGKQIAESLKESEDKVCSKCGKCCLGFRIQIPNLSPDYKRYFSYHRNTEIQVIDGKTFLYIKNRCNNLTKGNLCIIYEKRPDICRDAYTKIRDDRVNFPVGCTLK